MTFCGFIFWKETRRHYSLDPTLSHQPNPWQSSTWQTWWARSCYIIFYAGCSIICWKSKMQTQVALSTTESKYSHQPLCCCPLGSNLPTTDDSRNMQKQGLKFKDTQPKVHCKTFEDNSGALEMANIHELPPIIIWALRQVDYHDLCGCWLSVWRVYTLILLWYSVVWSSGPN